MQYAWIVVVLGYAGLRAVVIGATLSKHHGVDPKPYFVVDACAAIVEAFAVSRAVPALIDRKRTIALRWGMLAAIMFIVPDVYIFVVGKNLPWPVYAIIGTVVSVTGTITVVGIVKKVKEAWEHSHHPHPDDEHAPADSHADSANASTVPSDQTAAAASQPPAAVTAASPAE